MLRRIKELLRNKAVLPPMNHSSPIPHDFDPVYYLIANPDVSSAGADPYEHFAAYGYREGRCYSLGSELSDLQREYGQRKEFFLKAFRAIQFNHIQGDYIEFGCSTAMTFNLAFRAIRRYQLDCRLWAFDSFQGLPEVTHEIDKHPEWTAGNYSMSQREFEKRCRLGGIPNERYSIVAGFYEQTLNEETIESRDYPKRVALAYVDCDLYASTWPVLKFLLRRMQNGTIVAFDDYYCWSEKGPSGEAHAVREFLEKSHHIRFHPYLNIGWHGLSFIVEMAST